MTIDKPSLSQLEQPSPVINQEDVGFSEKESIDKNSLFQPKQLSLEIEQEDIGSSEKDSVDKPSLSQLEQPSLASHPEDADFSEKKSFKLSLKKGVALAGGVLGMIFLIASNPSRAAYIDYAANRSDKFLTGQCDSLDGAKIEIFPFSIPLKPTCKGLASSSSHIVRPIIHTATETRKNYGIFSIYITDLDFLGTFKTIGIANQFITFDVSKP